MIPTKSLGGLELERPGELRAWHAVAKVARLPTHILDRERLTDEDKGKILGGNLARALKLPLMVGAD